LTREDFSGEFMHIGRIARRAGGAIALAGCLALGGFMAPAAFAQGNDGTVKVDEADLAAPPPANDPHVDCIFDIEFFSFDDGLEATVIFEGQSPTGQGVSLLTDTVPLAETTGGGNELVGQKEYDLSSLVGLLGEPQENQGFHIKLTVEVPSGTHSTAFSKHKVFWVEDCRPTTPPTPPETTSPPKPEESETPTPKPEESETPAPKPEESETPAPVPTEVPAGADGASGGGSPAGLLGLAVVAGGAVAGTAVFARRRFLHDS
jgi:hypothetical protein